MRPSLLKIFILLTTAIAVSITWGVPPSSSTSVMSAGSRVLFTPNQEIGRRFTFEFERVESRLRPTKGNTRLTLAVVTKRSKLSSKPFEKGVIKGELHPGDFVYRRKSMEGGSTEVVLITGESAYVSSKALDFSGGVTSELTAKGEFHSYRIDPEKFMKVVRSLGILKENSRGLFPSGGGSQIVAVEKLRAMPTAALASIIAIYTEYDAAFSVPGLGVSLAIFGELSSGVLLHFLAGGNLRKLELGLEATSILALVSSLSEDKVRASLPELTGMRELKLHKASFLDTPLIRAYVASALDHAEEGIRIRAMVACAAMPFPQMRSKFEARLIKPHPREAKLAFLALARMAKSPAEIRELLSTFVENLSASSDSSPGGSGVEFLRRSAVTGLVGVGGEHSWETMRQLLKSPNEDDRIGAAIGLLSVSPTKVIEEVLPLLGDESEEVRSVVLLVVSDRAPDRIGPRIQEFAESPSIKLRQSALLAANKIGGKQGSTIRVKLLRDASEEVRRLAVSLANPKQPDERKILELLTQDPDPKVRDAARLQLNW